MLVKNKHIQDHILVKVKDKVKELLLEVAILTQLVVAMSLVRYLYLLYFPYYIFSWANL